MSDAFNLDILFIAPARFEGGTSTALTAEIQAAHHAGIRTGLLAVKAPQARPSKSIHPDIAALIDQGMVALVDPSLPIEVGLVVIHHPLIMTFRPTRPLRIAARSAVLVLHHPAVDAKNVVQYDLDAVVYNCVATCGQDVGLAPVSDIVRRSLPRVLPDRSYLVAQDWINLLDLDQWPPRPPRAPAYPVAIGRHARPHLSKWPDTRWEALLAYPDDGERYRIRILGGGKFLSEAYGSLPRNWEEEQFRWNGVSSFLMELDFYVYFHSTSWSEAFGRTIMEAMATELVVILPLLFEPTFGDAAVYCEPIDVKKVIAGFVADPDAYAAQARRARDFITGRFGLDQFVKRLNRLFPWLPLGKRASPIPNAPSRSFLTDERVLFVSTEGSGLGSLTRQLATAQRLPHELQPIFATTSQRMQIVRDAGYLAHFLPHHRHLGADRAIWDNILAEELFELIAFTRPRVIAFDGSIPSDGLLRVLHAHRDIFTVWVRRALWRTSSAGTPSNDKFDLVIEPGELAEDFDHGPTKPLHNEVLCVPPVLWIDPASRRRRHEARAALRLAPDDLVVAMRLGSDDSESATGIRRILADAMLAHPQTVLLDIRAPAECTAAKDGYEHPRLRTISLPSAFMESLAFDAAVSEAGYNSFHEQIFGAIPTLFIPNEAPDKDLQLARALHAELSGLGYCARRGQDRYRLKEQVAALLDPLERAEVVARCHALPYSNGAVQIAAVIADHARMVRTDYDVTWVD